MSGDVIPLQRPGADRVPAPADDPCRNRATGRAGTGPVPGARTILCRYVAFAVVAGLCNLAAQAVTVRAAPAWPVMPSVLVGTGVGFAVKYLLDKKWIFLDGYAGHRAEVRKVAVYGLFSVGTTLLFWGTELGALLLWRTDAAKYLGAIVGLALGNAIKYRLDKHYVFAKASR